MKKLFFVALALTCAGASAAPVLAAPWQSVRDQEASIQARIDSGVRRGALTPSEAGRLRLELRNLEALEDRYRLSGGIQPDEAADLNRRLSALSHAVFAEKHDQEQTGWHSIREREAALEARISDGVRSHGIDSAEASRLRNELVGILALEDRYRRSNHLQSAERADLDRRFTVLDARITILMNNQPRPPGWSPMSARFAALMQRIDTGVRNGSITQMEAGQLRTLVRDLAELERRYGATGGVTPAERAELERRYVLVNARLVIAEHNNQHN